MNEDQLTVVKEYGFSEPDNHDKEHLLVDIIKDC